MTPSQNPINEESLLAMFDRLIDQGIVKFTTNYRTVRLDYDGFSFEFRIIPSLTDKPYVTDSESESTPISPNPTPIPSGTGCRPGGDIGVAGFELIPIPNQTSTHILMANKFPGARPHYLLLTDDGYRRQFEALDSEDFTAAREVLGKLNETRYLMLFNCGIKSGCSRLHKHMHVFPAPDPQEFKLWPDRVGEGDRGIKLPFKAFVHRFDDKEKQNGDSHPPVDILLPIYHSLLQKSRAALSMSDDDRSVPAHNVILDKNWLVVVPRRSAGPDGAGVNVLGMLGIILCDSEEAMGPWMERGPANVLAEAGVPVGERKEEE